MATPSGNFCVHETLSGTTVDTVTLLGPTVRVEVKNRAAAGGADLWVTYSRTGTAPTDPVASADDTYNVVPGEVLPLMSHGSGFIVKILGNANAYSVQGYDTP